MAFYVYILLCSDGSFYTGYTKDLDRRTKLHRTGNGARYTKLHPPQRLAYVETFDNRSQAMKRERQIKKLSHQQKLSLVNSKNYSNNEKEQVKSGSKLALIKEKQKLKK